MPSRARRARSLVRCVASGAVALFGVLTYGLLSPGFYLGPGGRW